MNLWKSVRIGAWGPCQAGATLARTWRGPGAWIFQRPQRLAVLCAGVCGAIVAVCLFHQHAGGGGAAPPQLAAADGAIADPPHLAAVEAAIVDWQRQHGAAPALTPLGGAANP